MLAGLKKEAEEGETDRRREREKRRRGAAARDTKELHTRRSLAWVCLPRLRRRLQLLLFNSELSREPLKVRPALQRRPDVSVILHPKPGRVSEPLIQRGLYDSTFLADKSVSQSVSQIVSDIKHERRKTWRGMEKTFSRRRQSKGQ